MKTHTLTLLIIVIILSFSSCTIPADTISLSKENVPYSTLYTDSSPLDFIIVGVTNNRLVDMYKIYLEEAVMLPLCPDPLCRHNSASCTFFDINPTIYLDKETGVVVEATEEDWGTEYLDYILSLKTVDSVDEAIAHINKYNTMHSECIVTKNAEVAEQFLNEVDAACVYVNASTRFTDGFEFGFGAEIGISTQKLHARGPMGLKELTSYKYQVRGTGQIRG